MWKEHSGGVAHDSTVPLTLAQDRCHVPKKRRNACTGKKSLDLATLQRVCSTRPQRFWIQRRAARPESTVARAAASSGAGSAVMSAGKEYSRRRVTVWMLSSLMPSSCTVQQSSAAAPERLYSSPGQLHHRHIHMTAVWTAAPTHAPAAQQQRSTAPAPVAAAPAHAATARRARTR